MIKSAKTFASRFWKDESGATMIEYSVLIALITAAVVGTITLVGTDILARWTGLSGILTANPTPTP